MKKKNNSYIDQMHRFGRLSVLGAVAIIIGIPLVVTISLGVFPNMGNVAKASIGLLAIFIPLGISELLSYTPILGTSTYLTFITGNILNLKLPTAINALHLTNTENGTEKGDIIAGIAVAVSSIVTIIVIILGVLLMAPLRPVLETETVQTATHYILPALFGTLGIGLLSGKEGGGAVIKGKLWAAIVPAIFIGALFFISPMLVANLQGILIILVLPMLYFISKALYKRGKITVTLPTDNQVK